MLNNTLVNERLVPAKNGYTIMVGEAALHSRYDPNTEAEKYINSLNLKPYKFFILLEPGLGYLADSLKNKFPGTQIVTLHCSSFFDKKNENGLSWNPSCSENLEDFLELILSDADASDIKLIDWKPSVNVYGKACLDLTSRTVECIRRINAGRKTVKNFGKRWLKNALNNLTIMHTTVTALPGEIQVLVCTAGPSLEDSINKITEWKESVSSPLIIAVSSAVPALLYREIQPDIIVTTDGGSWARCHLLESLMYYEKGASKKPVMVSALTAALPSQIKNYSVCVLRDGSLWQDLLLQEAGFLQQSIAFPQRGTVSVTALDIAFYLSSGDVFICGLDFAHRDLLTHARPYAFDRIIDKRQFRNNPYYFQVFERENMIRSSGSHGIYATWFTNNSFSERLYTLGESRYGVSSGKPLLNLEKKKVHFTEHSRNIKKGKKHLIEVLQNALDNPMLAGKLNKELGELLLSDNSHNEKIITEEIQKALLELINE